MVSLKKTIEHHLGVRGKDKDKEKEKEKEKEKGKEKDKEKERQEQALNSKLRSSETKPKEQDDCQPKRSILFWQSSGSHASKGDHDSEDSCRETEPDRSSNGYSTGVPKNSSNPDLRNTGIQPKRGSVGHLAKDVGSVMRNTAMAPLVAGKAVLQGGVMAVQATQNVVEHGFTATTTATTNLVSAGANTVVSGGKAFVGGTTALVGGTTALVGGTMVSGGKALVGGTTALVGGTTSAVGSTGKAAFKGTRMMYKGLKSAAGMVSMRNFEEKKSKWEQGVEVIESLLEPGSATYEAMTPDQRNKLLGVKKLLIVGPSGGDKIAHVPRDLIKMKKTSGTAAERRMSSNFILQEFAGVNDWGDSSELDDSERFAETRSETTKPLMSPETEDDKKVQRRGSRHNLQVRTSLADIRMSDDPAGDVVSFVPSEFKAMSTEEKIQVYNMLTWDSVRKWDFNVFELNKVTGGKPLLFMGWAILGSPYAQTAMANDIGLGYEPECEGYQFMDELLMPPKNLCDYLRVIESDYHATNPYHNAIHAADVLQTLHCLIQHSMNEDFLKDCPSLQLFTILLSAAIHDVDHPGKTNAFYTSTRAELAVMYNDRSVLENWHVAHAFARMLNLELRGSKTIHESEVILAKREKSKLNCGTNILCNASPEQFKAIRDLMIEAVLHTDMTKHFEMVNAAKGLLRQDIKDENTWKVLMFMLHMADISGQAKADPLFKLWTNRCMDEFFAQGDEEASLGMPISPNCDRKTTRPSESQVGFIKFVVEPAYEVLAMFIPFVESNVLPIISRNLDHWVHAMDLSEIGEEEMDESICMDDSSASRRVEGSGSATSGDKAPALQISVDV